MKRRAEVITQLGLPPLADLQLCDKRGRLWGQLLHFLNQVLRKGSHPEILVLHLGENDLGQTNGAVLVMIVIMDLRRIQADCSRAFLVWLKLLQWQIWRDAFKPLAIEMAQYNANLVIRKAVGGAFVPPPSICTPSFHDMLHLYRNDGLHLTEDGCDI